MAERTERGVLNHLIETCTDAARGFRSAAEHVKDPSLKSVFMDIAAERERFAADLLPHAQRLGGDPPADGTTAAALHRGWIDMIARLRHDDHAIISEAARGDGVTLNAFRDAVFGMLPPESRELIEREYAHLNTTHARLVQLRGGEPVSQ